MLERYHELIARLPVAPEPPPATIPVADLLRSLAGSPLEHRSTLDALCRNIGVARRVLRGYEADWREPAEPELLLPEERALLVLALGRFGLWESRQELERGLSLKCLNAALQALDLEGATLYAEELSAWLAAIVEARV